VPGGRRDSKVKLKTDANADRAPKRQYRKTGANMVEMLRNASMDDDDDDDDDEPSSAFDAQPESSELPEGMQQVEIVKGVKTVMRRNSAAGLTSFALKPGVLRGNGALKLPKVQASGSSASFSEGASIESVDSTVLKEHGPKISFGNDAELRFDNTMNVSNLKSGMKKKGSSQVLLNTANTSFELPTIDKQASEKVSEASTHAVNEGAQSGG